MKPFKITKNVRLWSAFVCAAFLAAFSYNQDKKAPEISDGLQQKTSMQNTITDNTAIPTIACVMADRCQDITDAQNIGPTFTDPNCGEFRIINKTGCLDQATPEANLSNCGFNTNPTVWFRVEVDENAVQLVTQISTNGTWQPVWAVYYGDCSNLQIANSGTISMPTPCSNGDNNPGEHSVGLVMGVSTYYIAVSGQGIIDTPNFNITLYTSAACASCIGGDLGCNTTADFQVTYRSSDRSLDDPFFCQGEQVTICVNYLYDASDTGVDWLHGLIPDFGPGWDLSAFNPDSISVSPGNPDWNDEEDGACAPIITESMPLLCSYKDPVTGRLKLCNIACQSCPCTPPLLAGSPLPSGWFWNTNGGAGCQNDCSPSTHYGIGSVVVTINFCVDLKVREFDSESECLQNRSLRFNFQTTSDGVTGCWQDPVAECKLDKAQIGPNWQIDCNRPPKVFGEDAELCHDGMLDLDLDNENGISLDLIVTALPNANVSGAMNHVFPGGSGTIDDYLISNSTNIEIQQYEAYVNDPSIQCPAPRDTFEVTIYPLFIDNCNNAIQICDKGEVTQQFSAVSSNNFYGSCVSGQDSLLQNSVLFYWDVIQDGSFEFTVTPSILTDLNFAVFRSDSFDRCKIHQLMRCSRAGLSHMDTTVSPPVYYYNCMANDGSVGLCTGETDSFEDDGCTSGGNGFCAPLDSKAGERYYLLINAPLLSDSFDLTLEFCGTALLSCDSKLCRLPCTKPKFILNQLPGFYCGSDTVILSAVSPDSIAWSTTGSGQIIPMAANSIAYIPGISDKAPPVSELKFFASILPRDSCILKTDSVSVILVNPTIVKSDSLHLFPVTLDLPGRNPLPGEFKWFNNGQPLDQNISTIANNISGVYYATISFSGKTCISDEYLAINVSQEDSPNSLKIYPNPSRGVFYFETQQGKFQSYSFKVFDIQGTKQNDFEVRKTNSTTELDLSNLTEGIYILEISNKQERVYRKLVIAN